MFTEGPIEKAVLRASRNRDEVATGLLYLKETGGDRHAIENTVERPLGDVPYELLCPGSAALDELQKELRRTLPQAGCSPRFT